ncbi:unnamed protein product [Calicophoron daubneyi]
MISAGGAAATLFYFLWSRWFKSDMDENPHELLQIEYQNEVSASTHSPQRMAPMVWKHSSLSTSSHTSVGNNKVPVSSAYPALPAVSGILVHDSEQDEISSSMLDCGRLGLSTLAGVVSHLEKLMSKIKQYEDRNLVDPSTDAGQLINDLRVLLEQAYQLREQYNRKFILDQEYVLEQVESEVGSEDDTCSYFSALEHIDLSELELLLSKNLQRPLYCEALRLLDTGEIPCRALRTQLVGCDRDIEYLAKLHCLRQAFDYIFQQPEPTEWLCTVGRLTGFRLLHCLGYPTSDFNEAYKRLISFVESERRNPKSTMQEELSAKSVRVLNFYDIVVDYMLIDALELLSNPPGSVLSVTRHRWLSDNFKRVALDSTIWTILLAKRKLLKYADGFLAHYYSLTGTLSPALAWGFLGPDEGALRMCSRFREAINAFLRDAFICSEHNKSTSRGQSTAVTQHQEYKVDSHIAKQMDYEQEVAELELARREDSQVDGSETDAIESEEEGDDNSTVIGQGSKGEDNYAGSSHLPKRLHQIGLRYTTVPELAEDLYCLFIRCMIQLTKMFREEARLAHHLLPEELVNNPPPPNLRLTQQKSLL